MSSPTSTRRAFAMVAVFACTVVSLPSSAAVTLLGSVATQPHLPAKIATCNVSVDGPEFVPNITFGAQPNPVARYTVALAFFDRKNVSVGRVDVTDHGADSYDLPKGTDSLSCAISRLTLDDGTVYPSSGGGNASIGGVALGVIGAGAIIGIAIGASHRSSNSSAVSTAAPTATGATATPTATASAGTTTTATPSAEPTVVATTYPATPSPFPTGTTTAVPTLRPSSASHPRDRRGVGF